MTGRLIISGTREESSAEDRAMVWGIVAPYADRASDIGIGDCRTGVDDFVAERIREGGRYPMRFAAAWELDGKRAGPIRNGHMVVWCAEVPGGVLLAFPGPASRGTWDCVRQARAAGLSIVIKRVGGGR